MILEGANAIWYRARDCVANPGGYCPDLILRGIMVCAAFRLEVVGVAGRQKARGWKALFTCVTAVARDKSVEYHVR
jgi:hypothetical protein